MNFFNKLEYIKIIKKFKIIGYKFVEYSFFNKKKKQIILRHDVDYSPRAALKIAKIDNRLNVKSHFFFLIKNKYYNIKDEQNLKILSEINKLGHEIGLHFNYLSTSDYKNKNEFLRQIKILEKILNKRVKYFSFHRPGKYKKIPGKNVIFNKINAYGKKYFRDCIYLSDSTGKWRYGNPVRNQNITKSKKSLQLLMHPIWWHKNKLFSENETYKILLDFKKKYV